MSLALCSHRCCIPSTTSLLLQGRHLIPRCLPCYRYIPSISEPGGIPLRDVNWKIQCSAEDSTSLTTLPIFPLTVVALPFCLVPLQIFEARYRVLFTTLLAGAPDLEEGLVQENSPFKGTRKFGMCFINRNGMVRVGTILEIQSHTRLEDGRLMVNCKGQGRFRVVNVLREQPILICEVESYSDDEDLSPQELKSLSEEVCELYKNVIKLSRKVKSTGSLTEDVPYAEPEEFQDLSPAALSFWFASLFTDSPFEQQKLLEEQSSNVRLEREKKLFDDAVKYLSAASALKGAFQSDDTENSPSDS